MHREYNYTLYDMDWTYGFLQIIEYWNYKQLHLVECCYYLVLMQYGL